MYVCMYVATFLQEIENGGSVASFIVHCHHRQCVKVAFIIRWQYIIVLYVRMYACIIIMYYLPHNITGGKAFPAG